MGRVSGLFNCFLLISSIALASQVHVSSAGGKLVPGLSWNYYFLTCPKLERIVRKHLEDVFEKDSGVAPGILRLFFHDCFTNGCDASILLNGEGDEKKERGNSHLRQEAMDAIERLRELIYIQCLPVVSCADILVIAAREAVRQLGGPDIEVPLGRKDGLAPNVSAVVSLPPPFFRTEELVTAFGKKGLDTTDVVALSGAHTYGIAHCDSLANRTIETNPPIDPNFNNNLKATCPTPDTKNTVNLDVRTPVKFDNMYYINLLNNQGVFTSDQDIAINPKTKEIVNLFASDQKLFFKKFEDAFLKLSQLDVITDRRGKGEIRDKCFVANKRRVSSVLQQDLQLPQDMSNYI